MIDFKKAALKVAFKRLREKEMNEFNRYLGIERIPEGRECWIVCYNCGFKQWLAYGFNAMCMSQQRRFEIAIKMNWQIAPIPICRACLKQGIDTMLAIQP
jgi:hypothetical protein